MEGTGRNRQYIAAERLYSIYYKLRRERDEAAVVENLIHFMAVFYSKAELVEMSAKLIAEATESKVIREGFKRAIAEQSQVGRVLSNLATSTDNESVKRLFEEITTAFNEAEFEEVIDTVDQAFATQSTNRSRMPELLIAIGLFFKASAHEELGELGFGDSDLRTK